MITGANLSDHPQCLIPGQNNSFSPIVVNPKMYKIYELIEAIRPYDVNVLIQGESGTGKSMLAKIIYEASPRAQNPFVDVNCGSLTESLLESELFGHVRGAFTGAIKTRAGKIEEAQRGTLFLDDVTSASPEMQTKLLHVLENKKIQRVGDNTVVDLDVRFIFATNEDIRQQVKEKRFREDLYHRMSVINLVLPPLSERPDEILPIINYYIQFFSKKYCRPFKGLRAEDREKALNYDWPGNVRELRNTVERSFVLSKGDWVELQFNEDGNGSNSQESAADKSSLHEALEQFEKSYIFKILKSTGWNTEKASKLLKIGRSTLFNKIKRHKIRRIAF
jgi:DNA-binding NtrC family response regulator